MWFAKVIKSLKWWDLTLIKIGIFFFSFFIASYIGSSILVGGRGIWLALAVIFFIKPASIALKHL